MSELTNEEINEVSGGLLPLLGILATVVANEQNISDFFQGIGDGIIEARARHK